MMRSFNFSKKVISIVILGTAVLLVVVLSFIISPKNEDMSVVSTLEDNIGVEKVFIKDFDELKNSIDTETQEYIERKIYYHADDFGVDLYTGVIRQNSYSNTQAGNVNTIRFLVDVNPIDITYAVTVIILNGNASITVGCAPEDQQLDKPSVCENSEYS